MAAETDTRHATLLEFQDRMVLGDEPDLEALLDRLVDGERLAARFLFTLTLATGDEATLESTVLTAAPARSGP